jgi:NAD(P)-dependent dehydrogenase (short-subunit alcohol dehydrogenase family)
MDLGLQGRAVVVTGGSGGIGAAIARAYGAEGADVAIAYHGNRDAAEQVAADAAKGGGRTLVVQHDLADPASAGALARAVLDAFGRIDVLINNAVHWGASAPDPSRRSEDVPDEQWLAVIRSNLEGALRTTRAVLPSMRSAGWGRLVHISSNLAVDGMSGSTYYGAAKAALHGMNRSLAWELGPVGVLTNVVMPGLTTTDKVETFPAAVLERESEHTPTGRLNSPEDVAATVVFLGSAANTAVTGAVVPATGGR